MKKAMAFVSKIDAYSELGRGLVYVLEEQQC